jgi:hypothetical protein
MHRLRTLVTVESPRVGQTRAGDGTWAERAQARAACSRQRARAPRRGGGHLRAGPGPAAPVRRFPDAATYLPAPANPPFPLSHRPCRDHPAGGASLGHPLYPKGLLPRHYCAGCAEAAIQARGGPACPQLAGRGPQWWGSMAQVRGGEGQVPPGRRRAAPAAGGAARCRRPRAARAITVLPRRDRGRPAAHGAPLASPPPPRRGKRHRHRHRRQPVPRGLRR